MSERESYHLTRGQECQKQHEGNHFFIKGWQDVDGNDTAVDMMFTTPPLSTACIHAKVSLYAESEFTATIYRGAAVSNSGTPLVAQNNNQNSLNTPELAPFAGPTVTDAGTAIWSTKLGSGKSPSQVSTATGYEIIAKADTNYLFRIVKNTANVHYIEFDFYWYEVY